MSRDTISSRATVTRDPGVMRALAHPARLLIVEYLSIQGGSGTATELGRLCGLSPSATSYHMRELAKAGLVVEAPNRGDGRERVWKACGQGLSIEDFSSEPESLAAARVLLATVIASQASRARAWTERMADEPDAWNESSIFVNSVLNVTAEELRTLSAQMGELLRPYTAARRDDAPEEARLVSLVIQAYPRDPVQPDEPK